MQEAEGPDGPDDPAADPSLGDVDDPIGDEPTLGPPPHPMDRLWLHPSELPSEPPAPAPSVGTPRARPGRAHGWAVPLLAGATGALATLVVLALAGMLGAGSTPAAPATADAPPPLTLREAAAAVAPSIVAVHVSAPDGSRRGSGVCLRRNGEIVTSTRLVSDAIGVTVVDAEGVERVATVVGRDADSDLALLTVDTTLHAAALIFRPLELGAPVLAVGADRLGTSSPWVSDGIVSAVDARVGASDGPSTTGLIETDATGGMGVAGGALVDPGSGAVVGIVLAPVGDGGATYALPIPAVTRIVDELAEHGHVERGWLGLRGEDSPDGVRVAELTAAGPADRAGIRVGDLVADVDGRPVPTMADLRAEVRARAPGDDVVLGVRRDGSRLDLRIRLEDGPHTSSTPTVGAASGG